MLPGTLKVVSPVMLRPPAPRFTSARPDAGPGPPVGAVKVVPRPAATVSDSRGFTVPMLRPKLTASPVLTVSGWGVAGLKLSTEALKMTVPPRVPGRRGTLLSVVGVSRTTEPLYVCAPAPEPGGFTLSTVVTVPRAGLVTVTLKRVTPAA